MSFLRWRPQLEEYLHNNIVIGTKTRKQNCFVLEMSSVSVKRPKVKCNFKPFERIPKYKVFRGINGKPFHAECTVCPKAVINVMYKGRTALDLHLKTTKHISNSQLPKDVSALGDVLYMERSCRVCLKTTTAAEETFTITEFSDKLEQFGGILVSQRQSAE